MYPKYHGSRWFVSHPRLCGKVNAGVPGFLFLGVYYLAAGIGLLGAAVRSANQQLFMAITGRTQQPLQLTPKAFASRPPPLRHAFNGVLTGILDDAIKN